MYHKFARALRNLHRGQRGMTGLETAIILIAFSTVASVLAYSVLSAGIFSAERGKETVYRGLEQAQSTMEIKGSVIGTSSDNVSLATLEFTLALTLPTSIVDKNSVLFNFYNDTNHTEGITPTSFALAAGSTERGTTSMLENDEQFRVIIPIADNTTAYKNFTLLIIPPKGATLTISKTLPGDISPIMDLK